MLRKPHTPIHQDDSLLLQFILFEYLQCRQQLDNLNNALKGAPTARALKKVDSSFSALGGAGGFPHQLSSWSHEGGHLGKLVHYCLHFQGADEPVLLQLCHASDEGFHLVLKGKESLMEEDPAIWNELKELARTLDEWFGSFGTLVAELLPLFSDDENLLYFILKHKNPLDSCLGEGWAARTCRELFPGGLQQMKSFLCRRYRKRGFFQELPKIEHLLLELEAR